MSWSHPEIHGTIDTVTFQDARFRVVRIDARDPQSGDLVKVSASGTAFGPVYPGMAVSYQLRSARKPIYGEKTYISARLDHPTDAAARTAGVWSYLAHGGIPTLQRLADALAVQFGEELGAVLEAGGARLIESKLIAAEDMSFIEPELVANRLSIIAAGLLGEMGLDWALEGILTSDLGTQGPQLIHSDPFYLVSRGVASYEDAVAAADHIGLARNDRVRIFGAGEALRQDLYRKGSVVTTAASAQKSLGKLLGGSVTGVLARLIEEGSWTQRDDVVGPTSVFTSCDALVDELQRLREAASPLGREPVRDLNLQESANAILREGNLNGVTLVVAPDRADYSWVPALRELFSHQGRVVSVVAPDARGALYARRPVELLDAENPDVLVVLDCHRQSYADLARRARNLRDGAHLVLVGDDWLWNPNHGGRVFGDLVGLRQHRTITLDGMGAAYDWRRLGAMPQGSPRITQASQDNDVPLIQWRTPSTARRKAGYRVMAARSLTGRVGLGAVGEIVAYANNTWRVSFDELETLDVSGATSLCGYDKVPVQFLPGISLPRLALAKESIWSRQEIYAAMCAAQETLLFEDPLVFKPRVQRENVLNPLAVRRVEPWQPPARP